MTYDEFLDNTYNQRDEQVEQEEFDDRAEEQERDRKYDMEIAGEFCEVGEVPEAIINSPIVTNDFGLEFYIEHWVEPVEERRYLTANCTSSSGISDAKFFPDAPAAFRFLNAYLKRKPSMKSYWKVSKRKKECDIISEALRSMSGK